MDQPPRQHSGPGAATYALVAATAALAALAGVASALWLRQRQWATNTPPSSEASGSPAGSGQNGGNGTRHDGTGGEVEWEEGYEAGPRSNSVLGRCWEWLESASGSSHDAHSGPYREAGPVDAAQRGEHDTAKPTARHSTEHPRIDSILAGSRGQHDSHDSRTGLGQASGSYPTDSGDWVSRRQSGVSGWRSNLVRVASHLAQVRDGEEGGLRHGSATTPYLTSSIGGSPAQLPAQALPSAAPGGGYGAGGSWNAVLGKQRGAAAVPPAAVKRQSRSRSSAGGGSLAAGTPVGTPGGTPSGTPRHGASGTPPGGSAPGSLSGGGSAGLPGSPSAPSAGGTASSSFLGSLRSRASAASNPQGSGSHGQGSASYTGQSHSRSGGTPQAWQSASHTDSQPGSNQMGGPQAGSGQPGSRQTASMSAGSIPAGSGQHSGGSGTPDGGQLASAETTNPRDTSSSLMLLPLQAVVEAIAPSAASRAALSEATRDMASAATDAEAGEITLASLELYHHKDGTPYLLGAGTFGMVFKARLWGAEEVAVKVFKMAARTKLEAEFRQEVKLLRACASQHVAAFKGACLDAPGHLLMVMELLSGGDLRVALAKDKTGEFRWYHKARRSGGTPVLGKGKQIALDIARGLAYLHSQHVVHLDLKSPNVLLTKDGRAKIGDVGLARFMPNNYLSTAASAGTFAWSAPEVLMGSQSSEKADIFSFGVILWEIITGETPHRGLMRSLRVPEDCSTGVADLVRQCMEHTPARRPLAAQVVDLLAGAAAVLDAARVRRMTSGKGSKAPSNLRRELQKRYERCAEVAFGSRVAAREAGYEAAFLDAIVEAVRAEDAAIWSRLVGIMREALASPDIEDPDAEPQRRVYAAILALQTCITLKLQLSPRVLKELHHTDFQELAQQAPQLLPASSEAHHAGSGGNAADDAASAAAAAAGRRAASDPAVPAVGSAAGSDAQRGSARDAASGRSARSGSARQWQPLDAERCRCIVDAMQLNPQQRKAFAEARQRVGEQVHRLRAERRQLLARMCEGTSASAADTSIGSGAAGSSAVGSSLGARGSAATGGGAGGDNRSRQTNRNSMAGSSATGASGAATAAARAVGSSGAGSNSSSGFAMEATDTLHKNMEAESLALQQFEVHLIAEVLTPMQHARAVVAAWPLLLNAFSTGDLVLTEQPAAEAAPAEATGANPDDKVSAGAE